MPFGEEVPVEPQGSSNTRQFTGHERDAESGLDYMLARYYSSSLGRFMAVDLAGGTAGKPQSWNRYSYTRNNPLRFVDPTGDVAVDPMLAERFPKAARFILSLRPTRSEFAAYRTVLGSEGAADKVRAAFTPGKGQTVSTGGVAPENWAETMRRPPYSATIDPLVLDSFEKGERGSKTWLAAIIKHEAVHYLDGVGDGNFNFYEIGDEFELEAWGKYLGKSRIAAAEYEEKNCGLENGPVWQEVGQGKHADPASSFTNFAEGISSWIDAGAAEWRTRHPGATKVTGE